MRIVKQHLPAFFDPRIERETAEVDSFKDLLEVEWIKQWAQDADGGFMRSGRSLMWVRYDGTEWWVVAFAEPEFWEEAGLLEWIPPAGEVVQPSSGGATSE